MNFFSAFLLLFTKIPKSKKIKIKWFLINIRYSNIFKLRSFELKDKIFKIDSWESYKSHIRFVNYFYPVKNIFKSPVIRQTMFDYKGLCEEISNKKINHEVIQLSSSIEKSFNLRKKDSLGYISRFGKIIEYAYSLDPKIYKKLNSKYLIEFGPGLGFAGQLYSKLFNSKSIFFDLQEVKDLREILFREFANNEGYDFSKFEDYSDFDSLISRIGDIDDFSFISTWAFTETPLILRKKFRSVISKSKIALIISNEKYRNLNNFEYLHELAKKLPNHKHIFENLNFLKNSPNFMKNHQMHIFISKGD